MANLKTSQLPAVVTVTGNEEIDCNQAGVSKKLTVNQIAARSPLNFKDFWNATTNSPALSDGSGAAGDWYRVSVAGSTSLDGVSDWKVGDDVVSNGTVWFKFDHTDEITWEVIDKSAAFDIEKADSGKNLVVGSASNLIGTLPESISDNVGTIVRVTKGIGGGDIKVAVDTGTDVIDENAAGEGLENVGGTVGDSVIFQLIAPGQWVSYAPKGAWTQTSPPPPPTTITDGYYAGGAPNPGTGIDKWSTSNLASAVTITLVLNSNFARGGGHQSSTDGFVATGKNLSGPNFITGIDKFDFSTETQASSPWGLTLTGILDGAQKRRNDPASISNSTDGFIVNGNDSGGEEDSIVTFNFSSGAVAALSSSIVNRFASLAPSGHFSANDAQGYIAAGSIAGTRQTGIERFDLSPLAVATTVASLGTAIKDINGGGSSLSDGFIIGGDSSGGIVSIISKFNFSTGSVSVSSYGNLTAASRLGVTVSADSDIYYAGGLDGGGLTTVIEFFDISIFALQTGHAGLVRSKNAAAGIAGQ